MTHVYLKSTIADDNAALITWALRRLHVPQQALEDARQAGVVGLLVALERHDPERGAFRSFAAGHILHEVRGAVGWNRRRRVHLVNLDAPEVEPRIAHDEDGFDRVDRSDAIEATARFIASLDPADQHLLLRIYKDGATQTELAHDLGTNKMAVSRRIAKLHRLARAALSTYAQTA